MTTTSPPQKQKPWKLIYTLLCWWGYDWNCFSHNHFCKSAHYLRSSLRFVCGIQSLPSLRREKLVFGRAIWSTFRASRLIDNDTNTFDWSSCIRKSFAEAQRSSDRLKKMCTDARFLKTVEIGQYFTSKHTEEFSQFSESVACREYTLARDENSTDPKGWIRGNTKIGPVLEVTTSFLQGKKGVEIRIESVNIDNSHSWVRISHGLNKLVTESIDKEYDGNKQGTTTTKTEVFAFASRYKAKAQPRRPSATCSSSKTFHILERKWIDIEPGAQFDQAYPVTKRLNTLLRHGDLLREEDGAIEFWRKNDLRNKFECSQCWLDDVWKSKVARGGSNKIRFQYCVDPSRQEILYFRDLQGHSRRNPIDPTLQDNVLILNNFFEYIYHIGCATQCTLHHKFRIDCGRTIF